MQKDLKLQNFLTLEGGYLALGVFILAITLFVSTRPFMPKGSVKKWMPRIFLLIAVFIAVHYIITTDRMRDVKEAFLKNEIVICESRAQRKVAQSIEIKKPREWTLSDDGMFSSPNYARKFFSARCIVK